MAITFDYTPKINADDILQYGGYDITKWLLHDDMENENEIASHFLREISRMVFELIEKYRGYEFAKKIYASTDEELIECLKRAEYYQAVYIYENGELQSQNGENGLNIEDLRGLKNYSQSTIAELNHYSILYVGVM